MEWLTLLALYLVVLFAGEFLKSLGRDVAKFISRRWK